MNLETENFELPELPPVSPHDSRLHPPQAQGHVPKVCTLATPPS